MPKLSQKKTELLDTLHEMVKPINQRVPYINCGGCGIFAEHLYNALSQLKLKPKLVVLTNDRVMMIKRIKGKANFDDANIKHIVIRVGEWYIDSKQMILSIEGFGYSGSQFTDSLPIEVLTKWNKNYEQWNDTFDREKEYLILKKINEAKNKLLNNLEKLKV